MAKETEEPVGCFTLAGYLAGTLGAAYTLLAIAEWVSSLSAGGAVVVYALVLVLTLIFVVIALYLDDDWFAKAKTDPARRNAGIAFAASIFVLLVGAFGGLCRHLFLLFGGFSASRLGYWDWLRYSISWVLDNGLFNTAQIFDWQVSDIHATAIWARVLALIFNITLEILAFGALFTYIRVYRDNWRGWNWRAYAGYWEFLRRR
ncbi:MAG TPA: hypothetical protein VH349_08625 [Ktedonobacterales bacterium]|jgi:hypothetical protein